MGAEQSTQFDESSDPHTLKSRSVEALAQYIKDGHAKKIVVMVRKQARLKTTRKSPTDLCRDRLEQASAPRLVYRISDLLTLACMQIWPS